MNGLVDGDAKESEENEEEEDPSMRTGLFSRRSACVPKPISAPDIGISTVATKGRKLTS